MPSPLYVADKSHMEKNNIVFIHNEAKPSSTTRHIEVRQKPDAQNLMYIITVAKD